jgi:hypothetical protein
MNFVLTDHARKRCVQRKIEVDWIRQALNQYLRITNDADDDSLVHVFYPVPERGFRVLRVIYNETVEPMKR